MQTKAEQFLADDYRRQLSEFGLAMMYIIKALKQQPNFDCKLFEKEMLEIAGQFDGAGDNWIRVMLEVAGGKDPFTAPPQARVAGSR